MTAPRPLGFPIVWIGAIVSAEILGRRSPSDVWDAIGVFVFATLVAFTIALAQMSEGEVARRSRLAWRRVVESVDRFWPEMGVDLRGRPPVPGGFPPALVHLAIAVGALASIAFVARGAFPGPARDALLSVSPTLYFLILGAGWTVYLGSFTLASVSIWRDVSDHLWRIDLAPKRRDGFRWAIAVGWLGLIAALVFLVPIWMAWATCGVACGLGFYAARGIDRREKIRVFWRTEPEAVVRRFHVGAGLRWDAFLMAMLIPLVTIPATGAGAATGGTPITTGLGGAAAWAAALAFLSYSIHGPLRMLALARHDPGRRDPVPLLADQGHTLPAASISCLARHGFEWIEADRTGPPDPAVRIHLRHGAPGSGVERLDREAEYLAFAPRVLVDPESLTSVETLAELRRLDHALVRHRLFSGLGRILAHATERRFVDGTGFWLAPHLWYVRGLTRDTDDMDYHTIGDSYHVALPARSRQHAHRVFAAAEIDLVFAEDGVTALAIESVLERLFDLYDVWGPGRIEEGAFAGFPSVRVMLQDIAPGEPPPRRSGYPEPSYEEISRARILHIMVDRGDGEDVSDPIPVLPEQEPTFTTS